MVRLLRHRQTKGAVTDRPNLRPPRHILTLPEPVIQGRSTLTPWLRSDLSYHTAVLFDRSPTAASESGRSIAIKSDAVCKDPVPDYHIFDPSSCPAIGGCRVKICRESHVHLNWRFEPVSGTLDPTMQNSVFASRIPVILLMVGLFWVPALGADPPIVVEKVEVKGLWHHGAHNAFTDLIRWRDRFYCTFREGYQHVSYDGKIRVLVSEDGETWKPAALFVLPGYDLRDPELEITPDDRLMLLGLVRLERP